MYAKLSAVFLVFFGEAVSIWAELEAAKRLEAGGNYLAIFFFMVALVVFGGAMLIAGYMLGYLYLKNIWIIAAISLSSILVIEPLLAALLFRQMPTAGSVIGFVLGALGTLAALFIK